MKETRMIRIETALDVIRALAGKNKGIHFCLDIVDEELTLEACEIFEEEFLIEDAQTQAEIVRAQTIDDLRGMFSVYECYTVEHALRMADGLLPNGADLSNLTGIKSGLLTRALNGQNVKAVNEWFEPLLPVKPAPLPAVDKMDKVD